MITLDRLVLATHRSLFFIPAEFVDLADVIEELLSWHLRICQGLNWNTLKWMDHEFTSNEEQ